MKRNIKFVYFDVGGVMLRWRGVITTIAKKHKKSIETVEKAFYKYDDESCRGNLSTQGLWDKLRVELGITSTEHLDMLQFSLNEFTPIQETHAFATEIIKEIPIGLLTNIYHGVFEHSMKRGHIPNLSYTTIIRSCDIGLIKPEREIFEYAQKKAGVSGDEILFIDDFERNIKAADEFGWNVHLFETDKPKKSIREIKKFLEI